MPRSLARRLTLVGVVIVLLGATGCTQVPSNTPAACDTPDETNCGYTATSEGSTKPITEENFTAACLAAFSDESVTTTEPVEVDESPDDLCSCMYDKIVAEVPFDDFKDYDKQLESDPKDVPKPYQQFADECSGRAKGDRSESGDTTTTSAP